MKNETNQKKNKTKYLYAYIVTPISKGIYICQLKIWEYCKYKVIFD